MSAVSRSAGLMDIPDPSHELWPSLLASHETTIQPKLPVRTGGGHAGVEPPRTRVTASTNPGGLCRPHCVTSFAAMVSKPVSSQRFPEVQLAARQYGSKDGVPSVPFSATEYQALTQKFKHTLIAKFQVGRPPLESVKQFMLSNWKIEGRVTITNNWDDRHIVVLLDSEKDVQSALTYPWRKVGHTMFRLFRWTSEYDPKKESTKITKWIRLPGLPMEFFDRQAIKSLISSFANFLDIDTRTKEVASLSYARACVELDVTKEIPSKVWVNLPGDMGFFQDVIIEGNIAYCQRCRLHGHDVASCRKLARAQAKKDTVQKEGENIINIVSKIDMNVPVKEQEWQVVNRKKKGKGKMEDVVHPLKDQGVTENVAEQIDGTSSVNDTNAKNSGVISIDIRENVVEKSGVGAQNSQEDVLQSKDDDLPTEGRSLALVAFNDNNEDVRQVVTQPDFVDSVKDSDAFMKVQQVNKANVSEQQTLEGITANMAIIPSTEQHISKSDEVESANEVVNKVSTQPKDIPEEIAHKISSDDGVLSYSSEVEISEEIAQKFSSYDGCLFNCEKTDGLVDARTIFMHFRAGYKDDESFFRTLEESVKKAEQEGDDSDEVLSDHEDTSKAEQEGSDIPFEETKRGNDEELCAQVDDSSLMSKKNRRRKNKKSRSSACSCPKQKDTNFVWA